MPVNVWMTVITYVPNLLDVSMEFGIWWFMVVEHCPIPDRTSRYRTMRMS